MSLDAATLISIATRIPDLVEGFTTKWGHDDCEAPTSYSDIKVDVGEIVKGFLDPLKDGFQLADFLAMKQPIMEGICLGLNVLKIANHPDQLEDGDDSPTKWGMANEAFGDLTDNFDPEVDFTFPWYAKPLEGFAEEMADKLIIKLIRDGSPLILECGLLAARAKWPEKFAA